MEKASQEGEPKKEWSEQKQDAEFSEDENFKKVSLKAGGEKEYEIREKRGKDERIYGELSAKKAPSGPVKSKNKETRRKESLGNWRIDSSGATATQDRAPEKYKLVLLGEISVGKTSLLTRYMYDTFNNTYNATTGIDFLSKTVHVEDREIRLQLWDTAGQEKFRSLIPSYIRDSSIAAVVYDVTSKQTFAETKGWVDRICAERGKENIVILLVGNKIDATELRQVSTEEGETRAKELDALFFETSAKNGTNVKNLFYKAVSALMQRQYQKEGTNTEEKKGQEELHTVDLERTVPENQTQEKKSLCRC